MMSEDFSHGGPGGGGGAGGGIGGGGGPPQHYAQDGPPPPPPPPMYRDEGPGWAQQFGPPMPAYYPPAPPRPHNPHDDKLVLNKHSSIYPVESELKGVEAVVGDTEKALKQLSNDLLTEKCKLANPEATEVKKDEKLRELKGAYRVGTHAIGLLLRGECSVELVLMCANKPTHQLFNEVATRLPEKFESFNKAGETENVYNVTPDPSKASILVISQVGDHRIQVTVTLTSKAMREEGPVAEGTGGDGENAAAPVNQGTIAASEAGVLDRGPCLAALAALRHTTWFKTAAAMLPSCTIVLRVLKDICHRVPAWGVLDSWMIELLVPKCIISANPDYTKPGDVFRRVIECVASGLFLPGGSGLCDPCETGVVDASAKLTAQERANITLSAQHALRLIAFSKLHLVLGVDPLPPPGQARRLKRQQQQQQQQQQEQEAAESAESGAAAAGAGEEESGAMVGGGEDGGQGEEGDGAAKQTAGVKREPPSKDQEESEAVKKIKLES